MLVRKILAINLVPLALFLAAVYMLYDLRPGLITSRTESLVAQGHLVANMIRFSAVMEALKSINSTRMTLSGGEIAMHPTSQLGVEWPPNPMSPLDARGKLQEWWDQQGLLPIESGVEFELVFDLRTMESLGGAEDSSLETEEADGSWDFPWWRGILDDWLAIPQYGHDKRVPDDPETLVRRAAQGGDAWAVYRTGVNQVRFVVAVPVRKDLYQTAVGVVLLSSDLAGHELDVLRRQEAVMLLLLVASLLTVLASLWLARIITRPLEVLSVAAANVERGRWGSGLIPDLRGRKDEMGRLAGALIRMTGTLEQRVEDGKGIARNSAHEIRNALHSLLGALMVLGRSGPADGEAMFNLAMDESGRIERLADELANLSDLEDMLVRTPTTSVDLAGLVRMYADPDAWNAGSGVTVKHGPGLAGAQPGGSCHVDGHEDRLVQVIVNLMSNAASFSPQDGEITVDCRRSGDRVELTVADQGPGIPRGDEEEIFEWLTMRRDPQMKEGHAGVGLTISRQIVRAFGGEVSARNLGDDPDRPRGACFTVDLPAASNGRRRVP